VWMLETTLCGSQLQLIFLTNHSFSMKKGLGIIIVKYLEFYFVFIQHLQTKVLRHYTYQEPEFIIVTKRRRRHIANF
jgi:hypothetical protein